MQQLREAGYAGPQARKLLDTLFRNVHNLKASASANNLTTLANAAHEFENVLHSVRTGQPTLDGNSLPHDVWNGLRQEQKHAVQQALGEGAKLFLIQTDLDVVAIDEQFQTLKETLNQDGEVISTLPSVKRDQPGQINFRILYAAKQRPEGTADNFAVTVEEIDVATPSPAKSLESQISILESAFQKFAVQLNSVQAIADHDVLAQARRAAELAAEATGKEIQFEVRGDAALLSRIPADRIANPLLHLVRNAVDHGIERRGTVTIAIAERDDCVAIIVADDGRGIDPTLIEQIFNPGFSTAAEVSEISGRGVGLDAVKTTVEELGGSINVRSELGKGTIFEILIGPLQR